MKYCSSTAAVRKFKEQGADVIKLFATKSIRDGGAQTMSDEQLVAACGEARKLGLRTVVHAHAAGGARAAANAGRRDLGQLDAGRYLRAPISAQGWGEDRDSTFLDSLRMKHERRPALRSSS